MKPLKSLILIGGHARNRTGVNGFAIRYIPLILLDKISNSIHFRTQQYQLLTQNLQTINRTRNPAPYGLNQKENT